MTAVGEGVSAPASTQGGTLDAGASTDRSEWLAARRQGIGGSDVAAILGLAPPAWGSAWALWADKTGLVPVRDEPTEAMQLGTDLEPIIATWFHRATGLYVHGEQTKVTHPEQTWAFAHVDGFVADAADHPGGPHDPYGPPLGIFEAKYDGGAPWDEIPVHYQCQVQWSLYVSGMERAWMAVMHLPFGRPRFRIYDVERNEADIELLSERCADFWFNAVVAGRAPLADGSRATTETLAAAWQPQGIEVTDIDELADVVEHLRAERSAVRAHEAEVREAENLLKAALGEATEGIVDGELVISWRSQQRRSIDVKALRADHPELADKYEITKDHRVLRLHGRAA